MIKPSRQKQLSLPHPSLKHPGRWLWLVLSIPILLGLARLKFDVEIFHLLPPQLPEVKGLTLYQEHFANSRELILTVQAGDAEQSENAARKLAGRLRENPELVSSVTWEPPWLEHPEQSAELIAYLWLNQPPEALRDLTNRLAPEKLPQLLAAAREELGSSLSPQEIARLSYDPFGFTRLPEAVSGAAPSFTEGQESFASPDGTFRILFVQSAKELRTYRDCADWLDRIKAIGKTADGGGTNPAVVLGYTGRPAFVSEIALGMERDMKLSVGGTAAIIAILFWLAHRRLKPMLWLLVLLGVILASTLALGGLIYGAINVVSMGFAAILLGLAVDYAVVHYQEALAHPNLSVPQIRHAIAPSILWAATTTIAAFLVLNFGGLPGLGQLGTLVGVGVTLAATVMIFEYLPPLFPGRNDETVPVTAQPAARIEIPAQPLRYRFLITGVVTLFALIVLATGIPKIDSTANALRPRNSSAYTALEQIQAHLNQKREPLWAIVEGSTVEETGQRLDAVNRVLDRAATNRLIASATLPTPLWPRPQFQEANRSTTTALVSEAPVFRAAALTNGFAEASLGLMRGVINTWQAASAREGVFWPTNPMSRWIFEKFSARTASNYFALGLVNLTPDASTKIFPVRQIKSELPREHVWLSGWPLLGNAVFSLVQANLWKVVVPMVLLVFVSLLLAFRRPLEVLLSLAVLGLSGICLLSVMRLAGWSWNLLNLMAIPLFLGTGVDYSIFMQLALRRHGGDLRVAYASVGRALLLCGGTAIAGFGSLAFSSNAGMASLGQICAVGIACNMLVGVYLLPSWWRFLANPNPPGAATAPGGNEPATPVSTPSSLYRSEVWKFGLWLVGVLPHGACEALGRALATIYWALAQHRRQVVIENLLPVCQGDAREARRTARQLFKQFALKVADLWRFEAGLTINHLFGPTSGWEHFEAAQAQKRGILLLTPHLGNWEFGGPLLTSRGVALQVITLAEPGENFTELRQASRARWNIETIVIGDNPLAFVEIIRRLEDGATVALLVDRPPPPTAVAVELFGKPFDASVAAAELARASGCILLPVYLPRVKGAYEAHILPPIPYERPTLRDRNARRELTQRIMCEFEPLIREYRDQWYHFVPIWPKSER